MKDECRTKKELIRELQELSQRNAELEAAKIKKPEQFMEELKKNTTLFLTVNAKNWKMSCVEARSGHGHF